MKKLFLTGLALALVGSLSVSVRTAHAAPITLWAVLNGPSEAPPNASPGTGFAIITIDPVAHTMRVQATFAGLVAATTAAHIHCCVDAPGAAGVATQTPSFVGFPLGVTAGSMDTFFADTLLASVYNPAFVTLQGGVANAEAALFNGLIARRAYFNIHTTTFGGGEIRGFAQVVPEPATFGLLGLGLAALWVARRRPRDLR